MTAHELAKQLLALPDITVTTLVNSPEWYGGITTALNEIAVVRFSSKDEKGEFLGFTSNDSKYCFEEDKIILFPNNL